MTEGLTMRELVWMAEGRQRHDFTQTGAVMALLATIHSRRKKTFRPEDFFTMPGQSRKKPGTRLTREVVRSMKRFFPDSKRRSPHGGQ